jgi:hypothetical protein
MVTLLIEMTNFEIGTFLTCKYFACLKLKLYTIHVLKLNSNSVFLASLGEIQLGIISICNLYLFICFQVKIICSLR